jgi:predicted ATPase
MDSETDYRTLLSAKQFFFDLESSTEIDRLVDTLREGQDSGPMSLPVGYKRELIVPSADEDCRVARFDFTNLCADSLGASDFRAVATTFNVVVIERVPILTLSQHNEARRFITLVDELYEAKTALIISAAAPSPQKLFVHAFDYKKDQDNKDEEDSMLGIDQAVRQGHSVAALASVQELNFAFQRAASRLEEMTSPAWWGARLDTESTETTSKDGC